MYHSPTQTDFNLITQQSKDVYVQINLLNKQYKVLDHLDGNLLSDNYNVDSQSRQRRTYSCELHVSDPSFLLGDDKKIWIDKYIQVFYGIKDIHSGEVRYWLLGTFGQYFWNSLLKDAFISMATAFSLERSERSMLLKKCSKSAMERPRPAHKMNPVSKSITQVA